MHLFIYVILLLQRGVPRLNGWRLRLYAKLCTSVSILHATFPTFRNQRYAYFIFSIHLLQLILILVLDRRNASNTIKRPKAGCTENFPLFSVHGS